MKKIFGLPTANAKLSQHFGRSPQFTVIETEDGKVISENVYPAPEHNHGAFVAFMQKFNVSVVIAGGMGAGAQSSFANTGIDLILGAPGLTPKELVEAFLAGKLISQASTCGGGHGHGHAHNHEHGHKCHH